MSSCIFCKIIAGQIPCQKIYETSKTIAFLDIFPTSPGHCLVIPKECAPKLHKLSEESMVDVAATMSKVSRALVKVTGCSDYNVLQNNGKIAHQAIDHVHFHLIPKPSQDQGLGVKWPSKKGNQEELSKLRQAFEDTIAGEVKSKQ